MNDRRGRADWVLPMLTLPVWPSVPVLELYYTKPAPPQILTIASLGGYVLRRTTERRYITNRHRSGAMGAFSLVNVFRPMMSCLSLSMGRRSLSARLSRNLSYWDCAQAGDACVQVGPKKRGVSLDDHGILTAGSCIGPARGEDVPTLRPGAPTSPRVILHRRGIESRAVLAAPKRRLVVFSTQLDSAHSGAWAEHDAWRFLSSARVSPASHSPSLPRFIFRAESN